MKAVTGSEASRCISAPTEEFQLASKDGLLRADNCPIANAATAFQDVLPERNNLQSFDNFLKVI